MQYFDSSIVCFDNLIEYDGLIKSFILTLNEMMSERMISAEEALGYLKTFVEYSDIRVSNDFGASDYLDISVGNHADSSLFRKYYAKIKTKNVVDASNGQHGIPTIEDLYNLFLETIGLNAALGINWGPKFPEGTTLVQAVKAAAAEIITDSSVQQFSNIDIVDKYVALNINTTDVGYKIDVSVAIGKQWPLHSGVLNHNVHGLATDAMVLDVSTETDKAINDINQKIDASVAEINSSISELKTRATNLETRVSRNESSIGNLYDITEVKANKVTELTEHSTDIQYPSAKAVYDNMTEIELITARGLASLDTRATRLESSTNKLESDVSTINTHLVQTDSSLDKLDVSVKDIDASLDDMSIVYSAAIADIYKNKIDFVVFDSSSATIPLSEAGMNKIYFTPTTEPITDVDWAGIQYLQVTGDYLQYANKCKFKLSASGQPVAVNIQKKNDRPAIYCYFPRAVTSCSLLPNDYYKDGTQLYIFVDTITLLETSIHVLTEDGLSYDFYVYFAGKPGSGKVYHKEEVVLKSSTGVYYTEKFVDEVELKSEYLNKVDAAIIYATNASMNSNVATLQNQVDALKTADTSLQNQVDALKTADISLNSSILGIQQYLDTEVATMDALNESDEVIAAAIMDVRSDLSTGLSLKVDKQTGYTLYPVADASKLAGIASGAEVNVQSDWTETSVGSDAYILHKPSVISTFDSTSTTDVLSAKAGKDLQDEITNLKAIGRFLSIWNSSTGLPASEPATSPYAYKTGDYYIVGTLASEGGTNYKPDGSTYTTGTASTTVETETDIAVSDVYVFDGTKWIFQKNHAREIAVDASLSTTSTNPVENRVVTNAINNKVDKAADASLYPNADASKLAGIASGALVNTLEGLIINGTEQTITDKKISFSIPSIVGLENSSNKVTSIDAFSTDVQYPSAKAVYDVITDNEFTIAKSINDLQESKADASTTLAGYGITDAKIVGKKIILGDSSITVLGTDDLTQYATKTYVDTSVSALSTKIDSDVSTINASINTINGRLDTYATKTYVDTSLAGYQKLSDKITILDSSYTYTDDQYPSAKAVADALSDVEFVTTTAVLALDASVQAHEQKLNGIAAGAQVNTIETVKLGDTSLSVSNKTVTIPTTASSTTTTALATKAYVDAIKSLSVVTADTLPTASVDTTDKLYLIPSADPSTLNIKDEYVTINTGSQASPVYAWEKIGSTSIDLTNYVQKEDGKGLYPNADASKLADIETGAQVNALEGLIINGTEQTISNKKISFSIPSIDGLENTSNKVTVINSSVTDTQYPSAKVVYDTITSNEFTIAKSLISLQNTKADASTTLAGYGITDAKIVDGVVQLGSNSVSAVSYAFQVDFSSMTNTFSNVQITYIRNSELTDTADNCIVSRTDKFHYVVLGGFTTYKIGVKTIDTASAEYTAEYTLVLRPVNRNQLVVSYTGETSSPSLTFTWS